MKTTKHLTQGDIEIAIIHYLRENGIAAAAQNVKFSHSGGTGQDSSGVYSEPVTYSADVSECEDAPKAKRGRKAAKAEG